MKRLFVLVCALGLWAAAWAAPEVNIVPKPLNVETGDGSFTVDAATVVTVGRDASLRSVGELFAAMIEPVTGRAVKDRGRRREDRPGGRSRARRGGIRAAGDACGRRRARRFAERGALRFAEPAPAGDRRRGDGSGRDGEGQTLFRLSRRDARRLPAFHARGGCEGLHRHSGHA